MEGGWSGNAKSALSPEEPLGHRKGVSQRLWGVGGGNCFPEKLSGDISKRLKKETLQIGESAKYLKKY